MIPKLIIQTGPSKLPLLLQSAVMNVRLLHPHFEYRFYDDTMVDDFLTEHFPEYKSEYLSFRFRIQRYDFFRYLVIYKFGGFYLDLDVFLTQKLAPLLDSKCIFPFEELAECGYFWKHFQMDWQIGNYAFGAEAGHPFLAAIIENCLRAKRTAAWVMPMMRRIPPTLRNDLYITNTTGPGMVTRTLAENPQLADSINILFPDDVCNPANWHQFGDYGVHNMAASWRQRSTFLGRLVNRFWRNWNWSRIIAEGRTRGKTRNVGSIRRTEDHECCVSCP